MTQIAFRTAETELKDVDLCIAEAVGLMAEGIDDYGLEDLPALIYFAQVGSEIIQCISNVLAFQAHVLSHIEIGQSLGGFHL